LKRELCNAPYPSSYDALLIEEADKNVFCIEFKNQTESKIDNTRLKKKVIDSDSTLKKICSENSVSKKSYKYKLCIVYKTQKLKYRRFKENIVKFGLEEFEGNQVNKIITNDIEFFKKEFRKKYKCKKCF